MPLYDFACTNELCKHLGQKKEMLVKLSELPGCMECGALMTKQFSPPKHVVLRGDLPNTRPNSGMARGLNKGIEDLEKDMKSGDLFEI